MDLGQPPGASLGQPDYSWLESEFVPLEPERLLPGVIRTPLLTAEGCRRLLAEIDRRAAECGPRTAANSMHDHGVELGGLGLDSAVSDLMGGKLQGLLSSHFDVFGGATLDHHHSYLVQYGRELDEDLGFHVDDSEVTLNLCLGEDFSGAELVMLGARCNRHRQTPVQPGESLEIHHEPGMLVVHSGCHRHRVDPIRRGVRRNLIAWLRSSTSRATLDEGSALGGAAGGPAGDPAGSTAGTSSSGILPEAAVCRPWCGAYGGSP